MQTKPGMAQGILYVPWYVVWSIQKYSILDRLSDADDDTSFSGEKFLRSLGLGNWQA